ncbi:class I SAM-dependent methyltransferase [Brevibacterium pityocampae]|uniref:class I SAM-dependent methyltransferase n=2 Tax=Brevibacterium TaxID=1696 RepID=UPI003CD0B90C
MEQRRISTAVFGPNGGLSNTINRHTTMIARSSDGSGSGSRRLDAPALTVHKPHAPSTRMNTPRPIKTIGKRTCSHPFERLFGRPATSARNPNTARDNGGRHRGGRPEHTLGPSEGDMRMNRMEAALVDSPPRRLLQRFEARRLIALGGRTPGARVAELGCGPGSGTKLILDVFGAAPVDAVDLDPAMIVKARRQLTRYHGRVNLVEGSATDLAAAFAAFGGGGNASYDAVFDFADLVARTRQLITHAVLCQRHLTRPHRQLGHLGCSAGHLGEGAQGAVDPPPA